MAIQVGEYRKSLLESAKANSAATGEGIVASFVDEAASSLLDMNLIPDYELAFYTGTGKRNRRLRVDGYALDDYDWTFFLFIADFGGGEEPETLTRTQASLVFDRLEGFVEDAVNGTLQHSMEISTPAYDLVDLLRLHRSKIRKYGLFLLTDKIASEKLGSLPKADIHGVTAEYHVWDTSRFHRIFNSKSGRDELEIDLRDYLPQGIPCIEASSARTETYVSYLCVLPGTALADIYDKYGSRLLEGNVRSFLNTKVAVNRKIRETILRDPEMFFAYNNGIAGTASEVDAKLGEDGKYITRIKDLQIVNGGQTTALISSARYRDKVDISRIFVPLKLTVVEPAIAETVIPNISRSSNSQNKVSEADFFSNHPFHIRIEQISRRLFAPSVDGAQYETHWFYERARGQYLQAQARMTNAEKNKFLLQNPKAQLVSKTDLARFHNSWLMMPHKVSMGAQKNFLIFAERTTDAWDKNDSCFNDVYYQQTIALAMLFRNTEKLVTSQEWYEKGYRANIVTYSVALLAYLINKECQNRSLDSNLLWKRQSVPASLERQMTILAKASFDVLTWEDRGVQNVTEWSKRERCWERVKASEVRLLGDAEEWLADKEEDLSNVREGVRQQKVISGIEAQVFVVNLEANYWNDMLEWTSERGLLSSDEERSLLVLASKMPSVLPNPYQCKKLLEIRERALSEGFKES